MSAYTLYNLQFLLSLLIVYICLIYLYKFQSTYKYHINNIDLDLYTKIYSVCI